MPDSPEVPPIPNPDQNPSKPDASSPLTDEIAERLSRVDRIETSLQMSLLMGDIDRDEYEQLHEGYLRARERIFNPPEPRPLAPLRLDEAHAGTLSLDELKAQLDTLRRNRSLPEGQRLDEERRSKELSFVYDAVQEESKRQFEALTPRQLREQITTGINETLGKIAAGPVADGTGALGYNREWDREKRYDTGAMNPLFCSYVRFTKVFGENEDQVGVKLELLGLMENGRMYVDFKPILESEGKDPAEDSMLEAERLAIEKDGLAPADNRYYFIPLDPSKDALVSTESFLDRALRTNPVAAVSLLPEDDSKPEIEPITGKPYSRVANLQDLRDAASIVNGYVKSVKDTIEETPPHNWGRPGLTY